MSTIYPRAIRFADLWAVDHHQMVDEVYAPDIHMESMCKLDHTPVECGADLHDLEKRLAELVPQHRHELVRVLAGKHHACLETTVMSAATGEYAPACVWWWMADNGQVGEEVGFFDWARRSIDPHRSHGHVPPFSDAPCPNPETLVDALGRGGLDAHLAPGCVVEAVGIGPCDLALGPVEVQEVVVDGPAVAVLFVVRDAGSLWRGTVVLTTGADGRVISVRCYGDPSTALALDAIHPGMNLERRTSPA